MKFTEENGKFFIQGEAEGADQKHEVPKEVWDQLKAAEDDQ